MKKGKGLKDADSVAAMEIVAMGNRQDALAESMKGTREKRSQSSIERPVVSMQ